MYIDYYMYVEEALGAVSLAESLQRRGPPIANTSTYTACA